MLNVLDWEMNVREGPFQEWLTRLDGWMRERVGIVVVGDDQGQSQGQEGLWLDEQENMIGEVRMIQQGIVSASPVRMATTSSSTMSSSKRSNCVSRARDHTQQAKIGLGIGLGLGHTLGSARIARRESSPYTRSVRSRNEKTIEVTSSGENMGVKRTRSLQRVRVPRVEFGSGMNRRKSLASSGGPKIDKPEKNNESVRSMVEIPISSRSGGRSSSISSCSAPHAATAPTNAYNFPLPSAIPIASTENPSSWKQLPLSSCNSSSAIPVPAANYWTKEDWDWAMRVRGGRKGRGKGGGGQGEGGRSLAVANRNGMGIGTGMGFGVDMSQEGISVLRSQYLQQYQNQCQYQYLQQGQSQWGMPAGGLSSVSKAGSTGQGARIPQPSVY